MFKNSSNIAISRGTFSVVHGVQYNIHHHHLEAEGRMQFPAGDEWKIELYREYKRVPTGDCNLLKMICESPEIEYKYVDDRWEKMKATRVFSVARLGSRRNGSRFTSVGYRGSDAKKLFEQDCIKFSRIKHSGVAQLHAFNDSANPMIFFHDQMIPLQHIVERYSDCGYVLSQYISFQYYMVIYDYVPPFICYWSQLWVRPQDGTLVCGPDGPDFYSSIPCVRSDIARTSKCRDPVPPMPLNLYDSRHLLSYLASWLPEGFIPPWPIRREVSHPGFSFNQQLAVLSPSSTSLNIIAKFPQSVTDAPWKHCGDPSQVVMDDGRIRFEYTRPLPSLSRRYVSGLRDNLYYTWLAQALYVFERLNIPRKDWENHGVMFSVDFNLERFDTCDKSIPSSNNEANDEFEFPIYLFTRQCLRFPDGIPDIKSWTSSANVCYWSFDPDGNSEMTEEERTALGLPCYVHDVKISMATWSVEEYDFLRDFQKAKGFDPTTTNYARSIGVPILEVVNVEKGRFEVLSDENGSYVSPYTAWGDAMEVDFEPHRDGTVASLTVDLNDVDVDMEDCHSQMDSLVEVGMTVDESALTSLECARG